MKRFSAALVAGLAVWSAAHAQTITVGAPQLSFGTATETAPQTRTLTVTNPTDAPIGVTAQLFGTYGQPAFSVSPSTFAVAAGAAQTLTVTFAPLHNIQHNSELVLLTDHLGAVSVDLIGQGQYSVPYYNATQNLKEQALMTALKTITTSGHSALGYDRGRDRLFMVVDNKKVNGQGASTNTVECIYTGRLATGFSSRQGAQGQSFNTEHTWPQSLFNQSDPMVSDLHHLFPSDVAANGSRSNYPFGIPTLPYRNDNINAPSHLGANNKYEPRDEQKGRTARAMIYFVTRYQNYGFFFDSQQAILRQWSRQFPPTAADRKRSADVLAAQGNRNPFSDYPQLVDRITNFVGNPSVGRDSVSVYRSAPSIFFGTINGLATYSYVLVNNGTQPLTVTNSTAVVTTGAPATSVVSAVGPASGVVAPGESVLFNLTLNPNGVSGVISGTLNLALSTGALTIPFAANADPTATPREIATAGLSLNVYPNPATDELTVVRHSANPGLTGTASYEVALLDGLGRTVRTLAATTDELTVLDLRGVPAGLYVVRAGGLSRRVVVK
ncbi:MAG: endonuclease [Hymenobacteraceae bacterium]|nr:endonuclease [Hymenobacteraceae bacterium]